MAIHPGTKLGLYEIVAQIGAGGMGEVYRAHDTKLTRDVAIKVLPANFVNDPERLSRFQREARMLAALNHPNIATIYGLEPPGGVSCLVMELVPGETLAERIKAGPIPIEEALKIAVQIAEALEAAHEKNIIHRDLKPANVKVTPEGKVKVLDFGLAKAFEGDAANEDMGNSPTLSAAATMQGVILGTAAYVSPEQAHGKAVDKRTDIWAFGCVLYELLTRKQAFHEVNPTTGTDIWVLHLDDHTAHPFLRTMFNEADPRFSPDGRWIAYLSDESGRNEVYVQPYPGPGGKWQLSTDGGTEVVWNPNGREVFFRNEEKMMAVDVTTEPTFSVGKPRVLFQGNYLQSPVRVSNYDVSADGQRFVMIKPSEPAESSPTQINVVLNWFEGLKRLVPAGTK